MPDGRRLALWSERNQIVRLVSGGGQGQSVIRTDFLANLSAVMHEEKIYFVYQNIAGAVMFHAPDAEDILLFAERLENCRFGGLTLMVWQGRLFLLYTAWNSVCERYSLKLSELLAGESGVRAETLALSSGDGETICETELVSRKESTPEFEVWAVDRELIIGLGEECLRLNMSETGNIFWEKGSWMQQEEIGELEREVVGHQRKISELECEVEEKQKQIHQLKDQVEGWREQLMNAQTQLDSAVSQYNELAELTRKLQQEGKHWRDRYYQETKKRGNRSGAVKAKRISELSE